MHQVALLINIAMALVVAFIGGIIARKVGLPTIVGYLIAGIAIGPFTPGFVGDTNAISQLAELGIIFLMFGVGLHFSIEDLLKVKNIALPGALGRMALSVMLGFGFGQLAGWEPTSSIVIGMAISVASTVVLLRNLTDSGQSNTPPAKAVIGWVIVEDLATVLILVLLPTLANRADGFNLGAFMLTLIKAATFVVLAYFVGKKIIPWILARIAHTRSRELFILAVLAIALGIALSAAELFGVSFALGAFVAGIVVNESPLSHQVAADVLPFQEAFAVLFFVSIGMLVNPLYIFNNYAIILAFAALIIIGKSLATLFLGFVLPWPGQTTLVLAAFLSQIGEFSFIMGQEGVKLGLINQDQYSLILAGALISIILNPLVICLVGPTQAWLQKMPFVWRVFNRHAPHLPKPEGALQAHVVIIGYGRVGRHIVNLLGRLTIPHLVIEADVERVEELNARNIPTLYGDASNSEILIHAGLEKARALVVAGPNEPASELVVATAKQLAPKLPIIARAATEAGIAQLAQLGAQDVIHPELEGGLEIVRHTLLSLNFPVQEIIHYMDAVRDDHYDLQVNTAEEHRLLHDLIHATHNIEIVWLTVTPENPLIGQSIAAANLRSQTGASIVAILRDKQTIANPKSHTIFKAEDRVSFIGDKEQIEAVEQLFSQAQPTAGVEWET
ncbi:MAG: cation:proton antiporter [Anaerolineales bacterium]|nr:cation:proton antiporter [Anaerolineales bacterium]